MTSPTVCATVIVMAALGLAAVPTHAQSSSTDPPRVELTLSPGGAIAFPEEQPEPEFANYRLGGAVTVNLARFIAFEAEAGASFGISRSLDFGIEAEQRQHRGARSAAARPERDQAPVIGLPAAYPR